MGLWPICFAFFFGSFALVVFMPGWISLSLMTLAGYGYCFYEIHQLQIDKSAGGALAIFFVGFALFGITLGFLVRGGILLNRALRRFGIWHQLAGNVLVLSAVIIVLYGMLHWVG